MDLHSIPTHLHIVDRLLDFHVQNKRASLTLSQVTNKNSNASSNQPTSPRGQSLSVNGDALSLSPQKSMENMKKEYEATITQLRSQIERLERENRDKQLHIENNTKDLDYLRQQQSLSQSERDELEKLRQKSNQLQQTCRQLEEQVEQAAYQEQLLHAGLLEIKRNLLSDREVSSIASNTKSAGSQIQVCVNSTVCSKIYVLILILCTYSYLLNFA